MHSSVASPLDLIYSLCRHLLKHHLPWRKHAQVRTFYAPTDMFDTISHIERDALVAMEALQSRNEAKAREIQIANSVADKTAVTDGDMTFAGNTTTATGTSTQKSGIPAKKKGGKPKLSAKEKKQRGVSVIFCNTFRIW